MHIHEYLVKVAEQIDARAPIDLPPADKWEEWRKARQRKYHEIMGLDRFFDAPRTPLNVQITKVHQRQDYRLECLSFQSLPGLIVTGNLYVPHGAEKSAAVLYLCGHSGTQKVNYQFHARRLAQLGFVTLIIDTVQYGEAVGYHHGTYGHGWFHWISRGYSPAAIEVWNAIRALDLLEERAEVDPERMGVTGNSGGGGMSWWLPAADDRIKVAVPSCGTGTASSHIRERTIDGHCDCMFPPNPLGWSLVDFSVLIAPRPLLISSARCDALFHIEAVEDYHKGVAKAYKHIGAEDNLRLFTYPSPHGYLPISRRTISQFLLLHLQGKDIPIEEIADADGHLESIETLQVFDNGAPGNDTSTTVQDWFVQLASPPSISNVDELEKERRRVKKALWEQTFATFPQPLPDPEVELVKESWAKNSKGHVFGFTPEEDWRLQGWISFNDDVSPGAPVLVRLSHRNDGRIPAASPPLSRHPAKWGQATLAVRGTVSTAWNEREQWHLRRAAAMVGRTLASMQVLDTLQGLSAIRGIATAKGRPLWLAAEGEMAAVALYAALLDGQVAGLVLHDPPATQNAAGEADGTGAAIEMINCLRITDLPQVAGLLWPTKLVFSGARPDSYMWAEDLYRRLGAPGVWWNTRQFREWNPPTEI